MPPAILHNDEITATRLVLLPGGRYVIQHRIPGAGWEAEEKTYRNLGVALAAYRRAINNFTIYIPRI